METRIAAIIRRERDRNMIGTYNSCQESKRKDCFGMHGGLVVLVCYMRGGFRRNTGDAGYARDADDKGET